jgi:N-acetylmuramoyl-L-alanine amidase
MATAITPSPGTVRLRVRANIRRSAPNTSVPISRTVDIGTTLQVVGTATGERVAGVDQWYALGSEEFIWGGAVTNSEAGGDGDRDRPDRQMLGDYSNPNFETVAGIRHKSQGSRPNGLEGMIVHFDAYRIRSAGNGLEDSDRRCAEMLGSGRDNGFHYAEISRTGRIFLPEGFEWQQWGYHAGKSVCPATGRASVSQFYVGFEMNNPGVLYQAQEDGVFCPWFNSIRDAKGNVILDARGRCTRKSVNDEWYSQDQVRYAEGGNIQPNWYLPYSFDQFEALTNVALYLSKTFSTFSLDRVFGHDEVSPGRKNDPGGALANPAQQMMMSEFRTYLKSI